ncbi:MAG TPA: DUF3107 domain-containing protein [Acidimicrobiales bacterium]|nr:DUF3107 domain-containing protein [Acidimicrobiales bacterium]
MDVRIGIIQTVKELDIDLPEGTTHADVVAEVDKALAQPEGVLWLTDKRGRRVAVPAAKVAYIEIGGGGEDRRVGFGTT